MTQLHSVPAPDATGTSPALVPVPRAGAPRVSVVVPALNEALNLPLVLSRIPADVFEVILVDGHSTDDTVDVARSLLPGIRVVQQTRKGKGNAMACGFAAVRGDIIVMLDCDGSADPAEIPAFVQALTNGAHFAKGTRFAAGGGSDDITRIRRVGNLALNGIVNVAWKTSYSDLCYGYNAFWTACLPHLDISEEVIELAPGQQPDPSRSTRDVQWGDGFEIETLINVRVQSAGMTVTEVGSFEAPRIHGASNLNAVRDGLRVLRTIWAERIQLQQGRRTATTLPTPWADPAGPVDLDTAHLRVAR